MSGPQQVPPPTRWYPRGAHFVGLAVHRGWLALAAALAAAGTPSPALACTVCFGNAEAPVITGTRLSIVFLLVLTYLLLGGGIAGAVLLRRRARLATTPSASPPLPLASALDAQPQTTEGTT